MGKQAAKAWLILLGAMLVALLLFQPKFGGNEQQVKVSEFIDKARTGEFSSVILKGTTVVGERKPPEKGIVYAYADKTRDQLVRELLEHNVTFAEQNDTSFLTVALGLLPWLIPIALLIWIMSAMNKSGKGMTQMIGSSKSKLHLSKSVETRFKDVAGCEEAVEEVRELVEFLKDPKRFTRLGGRIPKGVLLMGPPGTGKTLLARAVAGEAAVPFISGSASEFVEMFVGVGASRVRDLFENGRRHAPCIIFIDELDAVAKQRGGFRSVGGHDEREQTLNQILVEMDGFSANAGVVVIGATNQPEVLDKALLRAGRFDRQVIVPVPDIKGREAILKVHARKLTLADDVDFSEIARGTAGMTGADLESLLNEAALYAGKNGSPTISARDVWYARDKILMGPERKSAVMSDAVKRTVAFHEAGHTIVGWRTPSCDPVHKVTIVPRGQALGLTQPLPLEDKQLHSKEYLLGQIKMLLGGRAAEELTFGATAVTTGASNDLERATNLVDLIVCQLGMSELGLLTYKKRTNAFLDGGTTSYECSEASAARIDDLKRSIIDNAYSSVKDMLRENEEHLRRLAERLIEKETLEEAEIAAVLGPRPQ